MLPALALPAPAPAPGEAWVTTLDVGQGLAVLVRTANRALLYDAGPAFGTEADSGERIVAPFLRATGIAQLDALVLTHNDADHTGGAASVLAALEVERVLHALPPAHPLLALAAAPQRCRRGMAWEWDGVRFEVLHPASGGAARRRNDDSCVLRVTRGRRHDAADRRHRTRRGSRVAGTGCIARGCAAGSPSRQPHVLYGGVPRRGAAALRGRRGRLPQPLRPPARGGARPLRRAGIGVLRTDRDGAVTVRLAPGATEVEAHRARRARYWHVPPRPA